MASYRRGLDFNGHLVDVSDLLFDMHFETENVEMHNMFL
jgi:hypothetical protein